MYWNYSIIVVDFICSCWVSAVVSHQRSRLRKLMEDYEENVQVLGKLRQEVTRLEKTLMDRKKKQTRKPFLQVSH